MKYYDSKLVVGLGKWINSVIFNHLVYSQDGSPTSYSKVSQAKITFKKVITTIALLSIAEKKGLADIQDYY
jgi:hypothetical protein